MGRFIIESHYEIHLLAYLTVNLFKLNKIKYLRVSIGAISAADVLVRGLMWASFPVFKYYYVIHPSSYCLLIFIYFLTDGSYKPARLENVSRCIRTRNEYHWLLIGRQPNNK